MLPVPNSGLHNHIAISTRLQLLKAKAHGWYNIGTRSPKIVSIPKEFKYSTKIVVDGHICLSQWAIGSESVNLMIFPILPNPSQQIIERKKPKKLSRSVPRQELFDMFIVPSHNLVAIAYANPSGYLQPGNEDFYVDLETLDGDCVHPHAAGQKLLLSERHEYQNNSFVTRCLRLKGLGKYMAVCRFLTVSVPGCETVSKHVWLLQIWDWQYSTTSNVSLGDK